MMGETWISGNIGCKSLRQITINGPLSFEKGRKQRQSRTKGQGWRASWWIFSWAIGNDTYCRDRSTKATQKTRDIATPFPSSRAFGNTTHPKDTQVKFNNILPKKGRPYSYSDGSSQGDVISDDFLPPPPFQFLNSEFQFELLPTPRTTSTGTGYCLCWWWWQQ